MKLLQLFSVALLASELAAGAAMAKPAFTTKYVYYMVSGDTPQDIYRSMLSKGPRVNGAKAYAATSAVSAQDGKLLQGQSCKIEDYRLKIDFEIKLPKIRNESVLSASDRKRWQAFARFLKRHEETHRTIWLGCAADLERKVHAINAKSCADADANSAKLWQATRKACSKKHGAFDAAEQKKLMLHPFVQLVYRRSQQTHAAKVH